MNHGFGDRYAVGVRRRLDRHGGSELEPVGGRLHRRRRQGGEYSNSGISGGCLFDCITSRRLGPFGSFSPAAGLVRRPSMK